MHPYIIESMALMGCGATDVKQIKDICFTFSNITWDTLDGIHNFGIDTTELTMASDRALIGLRLSHSDDSITCYAAYVNAYRNVIGTYGN